MGFHADEASCDWDCHECDGMLTFGGECKNRLCPESGSLWVGHTISVGSRTPQELREILKRDGELGDE